MTERSGRVLARMRGFAGRTELYEDHVKIVRDGLAASAAKVLGIFRAEAETVIRLDRITGFEVYHPLVLPPLLVLHYAGCRRLSGRYWHDAFTENVHMASFLDQRDVEQFAAALEAELRGRNAPTDVPTAEG